MDESKLVRAEAIQLVARYITVRPELVDHYFDTLLSCLDDAGTLPWKLIVAQCLCVCLPSRPSFFSCTRHPRSPECRQANS
jgi:hypothetical protein